MEASGLSRYSPASLLQEKNPLNGRLGGTQRQCGRFGEEEDFYPKRDSNPDRTPRVIVTVTTMLRRLRRRKYILDR